MKNLFTLSLISLLALPTYAQHEDTLINHTEGLPLTSDEYTGNNQWGYYSGMSHKKQQQFGERYDITEHGDVVGVIVHLTGEVANHENEAYVRIFDVASDGKPGTEIEHGDVHFHDLDLTGNATVVMLHEHAHVHDSFFATFDIGDYAHGGYDGDTIAVLYSPDGSREAADLSTLHRNVVQEHSHGATVWSDFYTGNNTPVATHFAIYPIVEFEHLGVDENISNGVVSLSSPYPNPAINTMTVPFNLSEASEVSLFVLDLTGKEVININKGQLSAGDQNLTVEVSNLNSGSYIIVVKTSKGSLATKFLKK